MTSFNTFEQQDQIPPLVPLKRKKIDLIPVAQPNQKNQITNDILANILKDSVKNTPKNEQGNKDIDKNIIQPKKQPNPQKIEQLEKKIRQKIPTVQKKDIHSNKMENDRIKQNEKTKLQIAKFLNEKSLKNLSQQLYPLSNQAIYHLLSKIEKQILQLNREAQKKQTTLAANQNNLHLKKQLQTIRRQIDHCCLIKELYYEKMNYRNKIQTLEQRNQKLESERKDLQKKVSKGLETIEKYKNGLPSDNQKQLREKLTKCEHQLHEQKETRQNLEKNIENIINNFKRLYQQAEVARQIVTKKLRQVQQRERKIKKARQNEEASNSQDLNSPKRIVSPEMGQDKKYSNNLHLQYINEINGSRRLGQADIRKNSTRQKPTNLQRQKEDKQKKTSELANTSMTLQQKIKKMRSNQLAFNRNY